MTRRLHVYPMLDFAFASLTTSATTAQLIQRTPLPKSTAMVSYDSGIVSAAGTNTPGPSE